LIITLHNYPDYRFVWLNTGSHTIAPIHPVRIRQPHQRATRKTARSAWCADARQRTPSRCSAAGARILWWASPCMAVCTRSVIHQVWDRSNQPPSHCYGPGWVPSMDIWAAIAAATDSLADLVISAQLNRSPGLICITSLYSLHSFFRWTRKFAISTQTNWRSVSLHSYKLITINQWDYHYTYDQ
jgi:hypothetical protein